MKSIYSIVFCIIVIILRGRFIIVICIFYGRVFIVELKVLMNLIFYNSFRKLSSVILEDIILFIKLMLGFYEYDVFG